MDDGGHQRWERGTTGAQGLLEVACQALSGNLAQAADALCALACSATGAGAARLEQRTAAGRRRLGTAGTPAERGPAAGARVRVPLCGGALVLFAPREGAALPEGLCTVATALLRRAASEADVRAWRQAALREAHARRESTRQQQQERRKQGHDLRAPLVIIKGYTDMLLRQMAGPLRPEAVRYLERVSDAIDNQRRQLDQAFPPPPRSGPGTALGAPLPLPRFLGMLSQQARRRGATLELKGGASGPALPGWLARGWLRALASAAAPGVRLTVSLQPTSLGWQLTSLAPLPDERARRSWLALAAQARQRGVPLEVTLGPAVQVHWEAPEAEALPRLRARG